MLNKFKYLLSIDKRFSIRLGIIALLILSGIFLLKKQQSQTARIRQIEEGQKLVLEIPELEKEIEQLKRLQQKEITPEGVEKHIDFKGVLIGNNERYAVIGDAVYREGDIFDKHRLLKISENFIVVENKSAQERKVLYLP